MTIKTHGESMFVHIAQRTDQSAWAKVEVSQYDTYIKVIGQG